MEFLRIEESNPCVLLRPICFALKITLLRGISFFFTQGFSFFHSYVILGSYILLFLFLLMPTVLDQTILHGKTSTAGTQNILGYFGLAQSQNILASQIGI